jgi:hypothetical protein
MENNRQNYSSVCLDLCIFVQQTGRQEILQQMVTTYPDKSLLLISSWMEFVKVLLNYLLRLYWTVYIKEGGLEVTGLGRAIVYGFHKYYNYCSGCILCNQFLWHLDDS